MDFVLSICQKNEEGVRLFKHGNYQAAVTSFSRTVALIKNRMLTFTQEGRTNLPSFGIQESLLLWQYDHLPPQTGVPKEHGFQELPRLFSLVVSLSPRSTDEIDIEGICLEMSLGVFFNLALAHHVGAMAGRLEARSLQKAKTLYVLATTMQSDEGMEVPLAHHMAILNNLGHIHHTESQLQTARECFARLLEFVLYAHERNGLPPENREDDIFLANALDAMAKESAPAA